MSVNLAHPDVSRGCRGRGFPSSCWLEAAKPRHPARIPNMEQPLHLMLEQQYPGQGRLKLLLTVSLWSILQAESDC